jgi:serine/threonine protein kinase
VTGLGLWLLEVLEATHRAGVVHRDVKPGNVQLCGGVRVVLTDFGIAAATQDGPGGFDGRISGSPAYMAPEQVQGDKVEQDPGRRLDTDQARRALRAIQGGGSR